MSTPILKHREITDLVLKAFYTVYQGLGFGFLEKVYENGMVIELAAVGLMVSQQHPIDVSYKNQVVGHYEADQVVEDLVIV